MCEHILYLAQNTHISQTRALFRAPRTQSAVEMAERRKYRESLISAPEELLRVGQYASPDASGFSAPAFNVAAVPEGSISLLAPTERSIDRCPPGTRINLNANSTGSGFGVYDQPTSISGLSPGAVYALNGSASASASASGSRQDNSHASPNSGSAFEAVSHRITANSRPSPLASQQSQQLQQQQQQVSQSSAVAGLNSVTVTDFSPPSNGIATSTSTPNISSPTSPPTTTPSSSATSPLSETASRTEPLSFRPALAPANNEQSAFANALLSSDVSSFTVSVPPPHIGGGGLLKAGGAQQPRPAPPRTSPPQSPAARTSSMISSQSTDSSDEGNYVLEEPAPKPPLTPAPSVPLQQDDSYANTIVPNGRLQQLKHQQESEDVSIDVPLASASLQSSAAPATLKVSTPRSGNEDSSQRQNNSGTLHPEVAHIYAMAKGSQSSTFSQNAPLLASLCTDSSLMRISGAGNMGSPQAQPPLPHRPPESQPSSNSVIPRATLAPSAPNAAAAAGGVHYTKHNKPSPLRPSPLTHRRPLYEYNPDESAGIDVTIENDLPSPPGGAGAGGMRSWRSLGADLNFASTGLDSPPDGGPGASQMQPGALQMATSTSNLTHNGAGAERVSRAAAISAGNNKAQMQVAFTPSSVTPLQAGVRSPSSGYPVVPPRQPQGLLFSGQSSAPPPPSQLYSRAPQNLAPQNPWPYVTSHALPQNA